MDCFGPVWNGSAEAGAALDALRAALQQRHAGNIQAILFYGSCLRSGDPYEGLVDFYVIVNRYRDAHTSAFAAWSNALLPPNVYYLQAEALNRVVRCKYAVLSLSDLHAAVSARWFQSYVWGRFCQPVAIAWYASDSVLTQVRDSLRVACLTFLSRALPAAPEHGTLLDLWQRGLVLSYGTELRAERDNRAALLVREFAPHFLAATRQLAAQLQPLARIDGDAYVSRVSAAQRYRTLLAWKLRKIQGKALSILRLAKALFTFEGGLDYIAWKLERHSGQPIAIPDRVRKYPLLFVWPFMIRLYRDGIFK